MAEKQAPESANTQPSWLQRKGWEMVRKHWGIVTAIAVILLVRWQAFDLYKIPTGSMEPTLIGHINHGDRILTNKLAYHVAAPKRFDVIVFAYEDGWSYPGAKGKKNYIKRLVGLPGETLVVSGGDLFLKNEDGSFSIIRKWEVSPEVQERVWYPVALPKFNTVPVPKLPTDREPSYEEELAHFRAQDLNNLAFPYTSNGTVQAAHRKVTIDGESKITYAYPVTNLYVKTGRWPFRYIQRPSAMKEGRVTVEIGGVEQTFVMRDKKSTSEYFTAYVAGAWQGIEDPVTGRIKFPPVRDDDQREPRILPDLGAMGYPHSVDSIEEITSESAASDEAVASEHATEVLATEDVTADEVADDDEGDASGMSPDELSWDPEVERAPLFFYGGYRTVSDMKLRLSVEVESDAGALRIQLGSDRHHADWTLPIGSTQPNFTALPGAHAAEARTLSKGTHEIELSYVDGTVLASLNGEALPPVEVDVQPLGNKQRRSLVQLSTAPGTKLTITRMDLFRDLYHTIVSDSQSGGFTAVTPKEKDAEFRTYDLEQGIYEFRIPEKAFLALGDNAPSSIDSRYWGYVPESNMIGRAVMVWWPPSRWRWIK